ncbi:nicotinate-nucleotide--dimethylbenzimidazole phosphoribosyltransferase [Streptomyces sp. CA-111067]|uniref:nicotinate-nucleotide--dimethylbenzimidazole phosphoribosyltransferase n=1 Tax=Streptomyces sp. CA-111067 TaxID=3240046 RepID=UPI003D99D7F5
MTDTGQIPGEGLPENAVGEAGLQPPAAHPGNGVPGPDGLLDGQQQDASGWQVEQQAGQGSQGAQGFEYLDHPAAPGPGIDDEDDVLLMPGPQGTWSDPQPVPSQPMPQQAGDAAHESGGRDSGSVEFAPVRAVETAQAEQPQQAAPAPRRPLHMGPPMPDATAGVSVRSLADRGPAHTQPPVRASGPPTIGPEYLDVPADDSTGIPVQQTGGSADPAVAVPGSEWPAAQAASQVSLIPHADSVIPAQTSFPAAPAQMIPIPVQADAHLLPQPPAETPGVPPGTPPHGVHAPGSAHTVGPPAEQPQVQGGVQPVVSVEPTPGSGTPAAGAYGSEADQAAAVVGGQQVAGTPAHGVGTPGSTAATAAGTPGVGEQVHGGPVGLAPGAGTPAQGGGVAGDAAGQQVAGTPAHGVNVPGGQQVGDVPVGLAGGAGAPVQGGQAANGQVSAGQQVAAGGSPESASAPGTPAHGVAAPGAQAATAAGTPAHGVSVAGPAAQVGGGQQVHGVPAAPGAGTPAQGVHAAGSAGGQQVGGVPAELAEGAGGPVQAVNGQASVGQQLAGSGSPESASAQGTPAHGVSVTAGSPGVGAQASGGEQAVGVQAGLAPGDGAPVAGGASGQQGVVGQGVDAGAVAAGQQAPGSGPASASGTPAHGVSVPGPTGTAGGGSASTQGTPAHGVSAPSSPGADSQGQQAAGGGAASAQGTPAQGVSVPSSPGTYSQGQQAAGGGSASGTPAHGVSAPGAPGADSQGQQAAGSGSASASGTPAHGVNVLGAPGANSQGQQAAGGGNVESDSAQGTPAHGVSVLDAPGANAHGQQATADGSIGAASASGTPAHGVPGAVPQAAAGSGIPAQDAQTAGAVSPTEGTAPSDQTPVAPGAEAGASQGAHAGGAAPAGRPPQGGGGVRTRRRAVGLPQEVAAPAGGGSSGAHAGRPEAGVPAQEAAATPAGSPEAGVPAQEAAATPAGATLAHGVNLAGAALDEQPAEADAAAAVPAEARPAGPSVAFADEAAEREYGPAAEPYEPAVRDAVHRVIRERRDIRNGFRPDPIPHDVLLRVLEAAHTAPSVGHSQPWDFVIIRSEKTREKMHELAAQQREAYAKSLPKGRARQFRELKIEAILDTPVNIVVTADPTRGGRHTLGRHTQPQMAPYSSALAVENLWLAARAEGLGVGWVSFFDERQMVTELGLPEHLEVVAYLCIGYVDEFPDEPELMQAGWSQRRPLSWVVHDEEYGNRALPGEEPHDLLEETLRGIRPLDAKALGEAWERQKRMTKPAGALGMLEIISAQLSGLSRKCPPPIPEPAAVAIFAGDHGVHAQGVTSWPQEVTAQMVANFLGGGAVCNAFANQVGAEICVIDVGVASELPSTPGLLPRKVRAGTADFSVGPAMNREEALRAIEIGIETARDLVAAGNKALLTGEMGIANTTTSAALISVYTGVDPAEVTGRGTGINDEMHARKIDVVRRALDLHRPDPADPIGVLTAIGGLEHAAMVGLLLGAAALRTPVILDGVSAGAAALVARAIAPEVLAACIAGHRSAEPGHVAALTTLGLRPLVDLDLRLGEGTGALLALPLVQSAARVMHEVATFDAAGVTEKA